VRKPVTLITGAGGEIGHGLVTRLAAAGSVIVTLDVRPLDATLAPLVSREFTGSITDVSLLERILAEFEIYQVYHLAALLSTRAEFTPVTAHSVNVEGTLNLLEFAQREGESHGTHVVFVYPSSIAVYGLPAPGGEAVKKRIGRVREDEYTHPTTMYGCNKLYSEQLGRYYAWHYKQLSAEVTRRVDFRAARFPGLISAETVPSGGTSDYAPEMIHAAVRGESYECFVRPDTTIPFMTMPDAVDALLALAAAPREALRRTEYNLRAFNALGSPDSRPRDRRMPRSLDHVQSGRQTSGDSRQLAGRCRRFCGPRRLGLQSDVRFRASVPRVPDADDPRPVSSRLRCP
jgi:nucleoside-diphosphate-sugar epimerase